MPPMASVSFGLSLLRASASQFGAATEFASCRSVAATYSARVRTLISSATCALPDEHGGKVRGETGSGSYKGGTTGSSGLSPEEVSPYSYFSKSGGYGDVLETTPVERADMYNWGLEHERTQLEQEYEEVAEERGKLEELEAAHGEEEVAARRCMADGQPGVVVPGLEGQAAELPDQVYDMGAAEEAEYATKAWKEHANKFHLY